MHQDERFAILMDLLVREIDPFMSLDEQSGGYRVLFIDAGHACISLAVSDSLGDAQDNLWHVLLSEDKDAWGREEGILIAERARDDEIVNLVRACNLV